MDVKDVFASSEFCFFLFLSGIHCQVSILSFVSLDFPTKACWVEFGFRNHPSKLAISELKLAMCICTFFFLWHWNNSLEKDVRIYLVCHSVLKQDFISILNLYIFYLVYSGVFPVMFPQLPLLANRVIV